jgi:hypothetical protein
LLEQKISQEYVSVEAFETLMRATVIAFMARSDVTRMAYAWPGVGWAPSSMPMQNHPKWPQSLSLAAHMILNHPYGSGQDNWLTFVILYNYHGMRSGLNMFKMYYTYTRIYIIHVNTL